MEAFTENIPTGWTTTTATAVTSSTQTHSGTSAVSLANGGNLSQTITVQPNNYYNFSFYAKGSGSNTGLTGTVEFLDSSNQATTAATIQINQPDLPSTSFGFYNGVTIIAPANTVSARITFTAAANDSQTVIIDDVSLTQR